VAPEQPETIESTAITFVIGGLWLLGAPKPSFPQRQTMTHRPRSRALLPWRAERACFPRQTRTITDEWRSPLSQADRPTDQGASPVTEWNVTLYGPRFGAMRVGRGPSVGPSCRGAERRAVSQKGRRAERAFSPQSVVTNPWAHGRPVTSQTGTSTDRGTDPSFPGRLCCNQWPQTHELLNMSASISAQRVPTPLLPPKLMTSSSARLST
jgi:hypothetical protein